jgi:DNA-binding response OmpR family regulator
MGSAAESHQEHAPIQRSFILVVAAADRIDADAIAALQSRGDVCVRAPSVERAAVLTRTFRAAAIVVDAALANELLIDVLRRTAKAGNDDVPVIAVSPGPVPIAGFDSIVRMPCAPSDLAAAVISARVARLRRRR